MGCIVAVIALLSPRFAFFLVWVFGERVSIAYNGFIVPFLGWLFLPWTALVYAFAYAPGRGVSFIGWLFVFFAFCLDIGSYSSGAKARSDR